MNSDSHMCTLEEGRCAEYKDDDQPAVSGRVDLSRLTWDDGDSLKRSKDSESSQRCQVPEIDPHCNIAAM